MSYGAIRQRTHEAAQPQEADGPQKCEAIGCPCIATLKVEGGRWCCTSHAFAPSERWPRITEGLREHDWLLQFTREVQKMDRMSDDWRTFAERFWDGQDDYCKPVAGEFVNGKRTKAESFIAYFNRMKGELDYRLGLCKRPSPRIPEDIGNLFMDFAKRRTA